MKFSAIVAILFVDLVTAGPVARRARGGGNDVPDINSGFIQPPNDDGDLPNINTGFIQPSNDDDDFPNINTGFIQPPPLNENAPRPLPLSGARDDNAIFSSKD
ncbi:uncharacterized protein BBA_09155 [Beauveria bassiana ARSEF 2860]|uniref:Uncharacterized protein n=1 Tax=Beauveria bassiana (strain ARSEF 2860) TaxID=655819 RepID=J5J5R1_BEAB2|nr:uncharacterized protein BBA_09155 [Beauveria bassiana ARSEF 2860]EJP61903.1 hypothetical protein BBA_09155 [Beauveria bassiana ARSEF 2860]